MKSSFTHVSFDSARLFLTRSRVLAALTVLAVPALAASPAALEQVRLDEQLSSPADAAYLKKQGDPRRLAVPDRVSQGAGTFLSPGESVTFRLLPSGTPILLTGGFRVVVPQGATELRINLDVLTFGADVDLGARFGQDLSLPLAGNSDELSSTPGQASEEIVITAASDPPLQPGIYFIGLILLSLNQTVDCRITAEIAGGSPQEVGTVLASGNGRTFSIPAVGAPELASGSSGFRIEIPPGSSQLSIQLRLNDAAARARIYARQGFDIGLFGGTPVFDWRSPGSSNSEDLTITTGINPSLAPGTVFIGLALDSPGVPFDGTITATISVENTPAFGLSISVLSFNSIFGSNPADKAFTVTNVGGGTLAYTLQPDQPWIVVNPTSETSAGEPDIITVSIDATGLLPGLHTGRVRIAQTDGPLESFLNVQLTVGGTAPPQLSVSPDSIAVDVVRGQTTTTSFSVSNAGGGVSRYSIISNQAWLSATPGMGATTGQAQTIVIVVNANDLGPGAHSGILTISDTAAQQQAQVEVIATVSLAEPSVLLSVDSIAFVAAADGSAPPPEMFSVGNEGLGTLDYNILVSEPWITVAPLAGSITDGMEQHTVNVNPDGLGPGMFSGRITVQQAPLALKPSARRNQTIAADITVTLTVPLDETLPTVPANAVLNAASFVQAPADGHALAPGSIVSIFGTNFGPGVAIGSVLPLPVTLDGVGATFDGIPAALFFVGTGQINAQLPFGLTDVTAELIVTGPSGQSAPREVPVSTFGPGIFTFDQSGSGQVIATYPAVPGLDPSEIGALVAPRGLTANSRPASAGDVITLWVNGLGPVTPPIENGRNSFDPGGFVLRNTATRPTVRFGAFQVPDGNILFSGLAPEFVGLYQINILVPPGTPLGDAAPVVITIGSVMSRTDATLALE